MGNHVNGLGLVALALAACSSDSEMQRWETTFPESACTLEEPFQVLDENNKNLPVGECSVTAKAWKSERSDGSEQAGAAAIEVRCAGGIVLSLKVPTDNGHASSPQGDAVVVVEAGAIDGPIAPKTLQIGFRRDGSGELRSVRGDIESSQPRYWPGESPSEGKLEFLANLRDVFVTTEDGKTVRLLGGIEVNAESKSAGSGGGGGGGGGDGSGEDCSKAWTCAEDGQATPLCGAACTYTGSQRTETCAVLGGFGEKAKSCCSVCR